MKQRITQLQIAELSSEQTDKLRSRWKPQEGDYIAIGDHEEMIYYLNGVDRIKSLPLLNVGQILQFLSEHGRIHAMHQDDREWVVNDRYRAGELCDALWQALIDCL
ncbi:hypothetical protein [Paenibacillus hexagrammi]|uniref:Uncharacterized protein n=1 Tax=Paenibacillus hexagrammi TaxID=2908839 RepID=A0ABY3SK68_9BACL|nr:hypothetical protein [Paenibacillus sp. YPD9-1]UJF34247.1 hypothetical protein L0M14_03170 [Paenibacillus sp. YPD9-1]